MSEDDDFDSFEPNDDRTVAKDGSVTFPEGVTIPGPQPSNLDPSLLGADRVARVASTPTDHAETEGGTEADFGIDPMFVPPGSAEGASAHGPNLCDTCTRCWRREIAGRIRTGPGLRGVEVVRFCMQPPYLVNLAESTIVACNQYVERKS